MKLKINNMGRAKPIEVLHVGTPGDVFTALEELGNLYDYEIDTITISRGPALNNPSMFSGVVTYINTVDYKYRICDYTIKN